MPRSRQQIVATTGIVTAVWLLLDQATKLLAVKELTGQTVDLGFMDLRLIYNDGGAFSIPGPDWLFLGVTVLVAVLVVRVLPQTDRISLAAAYGLVLGGALGNGADRIFRDGRVVDFFDLRWFPVFNVADIGITVGAVGVALLMIMMERRGKPTVARAVEE